MKSTAVKTLPKKRPERIPFRVVKGGLEPDGEGARSRLRARGYRIGDSVWVTITKPRNPKFWGLAHKFGELVANNIEAFTGMAPHTVLKKIQLEGDIACDEIPLIFPGLGPCAYRIPQSLSFETMEQGEFHQVFTAMCRYISQKYWPECSPEQIEQMTSLMVEET